MKEVIFDLQTAVGPRSVDRTHIESYKAFVGNFYEYNAHFDNECCIMFVVFIEPVYLTEDPTSQISV